MHTRPISDLQQVIRRCRCGGDVGLQHFGCLECGAACCSACAVPLESVAYCRRCAAALLDAAKILNTGPFELY